MSAYHLEDDISCLVAWSTPLYVELSEAVDEGSRHSVYVERPVSEDQRLSLELWSEQSADGDCQLNARLFWRSETGKRWDDDNWFTFGGLGAVDDIVFVGDYADPCPDEDSGEFVHYYTFDVRTELGDYDLSIRVWRIADTGDEPGLEFVQAWLTPRPSMVKQPRHSLAA
jgi:hypothetical protein